MLGRFAVLVLLFSLFIASTCEREVKLDLDDLNDKLVIYSAFSAGDTLRLQLGKSKKVINRDPAEFLPGAEVNLYEDDIFLEKLDFIVPGGNNRTPPYYKSQTDDVIKVGKTYRIEAILDGFETVEAKSTIPYPVTIRFFDFFELQIDSESEPGFITYSYYVNAKINDPQSQENYYHLIAYQEIWAEELVNGTLVSNPYYVPLRFDDASNTNDVVSYDKQGVLLKDNPFEDGYRFDLENFRIRSSNVTIGRVIIELRTVSKAYYLFHTSISQQQGATDLLFTEPVFIYENISNGHGIFAGYSTQFGAIELQE